MAGAFTPPPPSGTDIQSTDWVQYLTQVWGTFSGNRNWSRLVDLTGLDDDANPSVSIRNLGAGGALDVFASGGARQFRVNDSGVQVASLLIDNDLTVGDDLHVLGDTDLDGALNVDGGAVLASLLVTGDETVDQNLLVNGTSTLHVTTATDLTATGTVALGDANTDVITVIGVTTFRNVAAAVQLFVDAGNNRVVVGSGTALGSDTTPNLQVVGRLYVAPESANDFAAEIRRSSAVTVGWRVGVTSTNDLVFKDLTGAETVRAGAAAATYQLVVTGQAHFTNGAVYDGGGLLVTAGGLTVAGGGLGVTGSSVFNSGLTVIGGLTVTTVGLAVTGPSVFHSAVSFTAGGVDISGGLTLNSGGIDVTGGTVTDTLTADAARFDASKNKILHDGSGAKSVTDTAGYTWLPYSLGKPTGNPGTPTGSSGSVPLAIDLTNLKLCFWDGSVWRTSPAAFV